MTKHDDRKSDFQLELTSKKTLQIDVAKYQPYLDDPSLSEHQKEEIITALWQIIVAFVDLGYEVHPVQLACGQLDETVDLGGKTDSNESKPLFETMHEEFNAAACDT